MGSPGRTPILQDGGEQEAVRVAPPRLARAAALLLPDVLVVVLKAATLGLVVLHVRGAPRSNAEQLIDSSSRDGHAAAVIYGDRVSCLSVAPDLQVDGLNQTSCVRIGGAGGPGNAGKKLSDAGGSGGGLDLVEHGGSWGDHARVARRPAHGADGAGDVH